MRPETRLNFLFLTPDLLPPPPLIVLANLSDNCSRELLTTHSRNPMTLSLGTEKAHNFFKSFYGLTARLWLSA